MTARRHERLDYTRRRLIQAFGASAGALITVPFIASNAYAQPAFTTDPFTLGVASGDPWPDGFVIWTRLAPKPFDIGHGMPSSNVMVDWEVASDESFATVVQKGQATASPIMGHSIRQEITGLLPGRHYWYRFRAGGAQSPAGRAKTAPAPGSSLAHARFATAGCQHYEGGLFTAHKYLANEDLDFVYGYGDYIYEGAGRTLPPGASPNARAHLGGACMSLDDYRRRYAQYKSDPDLQACHAAHSWFPVWDDHEIENNWVAAIDMAADPAYVFNYRRQAAAQAYYEHMPFRRTSAPAGVAMQIYRRAAYGDLLGMNFLDTRQFRSDQPCGDRYPSTCAEIDAPAAEVIGREQEAWLLSQPNARWNVLAQQVMMMDLDRSPGDAVAYNVDSWAGYRTPRNRLLSSLQARNTPNLVVLTGDEHVNYAGEVHLDGKAPGARPIAIEFVGTSVASGGDGQDQDGNARNYLAANPTLKFANQQRGYLVCDVTPERWQAEFKVLDKISEPGGLLSTRAKFAIENGSSRLT